MLVLQIDHHLGNTAITLPILQEIAGHFTHGIDLLVDARYAALGRQVDNVNRLEFYPAQRTVDGRSRSPSGQIIALHLRLLARRYHAVIDLGGSTRSSMMTLISASPRRFGFDDVRRPWCYSHVVVPPKTTRDGPHAFDRYALMLRVLGRDPQTQPPSLLPPQLDGQPNDDQLRARLDHLWPDPAPGSGADSSPSIEEDRNTDTEASYDGVSDGEPNSDSGSVPAAAPLIDPRPRVLIHPSAGIAWRCWPPERFAAVADALIREKDARVLVLGTAAEQPLADQLIAASRHPRRIRFHAGPLDQLLTLIRAADLIVSNESGPTHLATLAGLPAVTIFGPTSEAIWSPLTAHPDRLRVLRGTHCDPGCHGRTCVADRQCLLQLPADRVAQAALEMLAHTHRPAVDPGIGASLGADS